MKIKELIEILQKYDPEMRITFDGYETGLEEIDSGRIELIDAFIGYNVADKTESLGWGRHYTAGQKCNWYDGHHKQWDRVSQEVRDKHPERKETVLNLTRKNI